jgi:hypothetical protein
MEGSINPLSAQQPTRHRSEAKYSNNRHAQKKMQGRSVDRVNSTRDHEKSEIGQGISLGNLLTNIKVNN